MPPPLPPRVKLGRMMVGKPTSAWIFWASSRLRAILARGHSRPISPIATRNNSRSSAMRMASRDAPINSTPYLSSTPASARFSAQLSAVWPPIVGSRASGFSLAMMRSTVATLIGSM